jgi:menaquinone-9 beta-reductase
MNPITIVGGGLSGLALGVALCKRQIPVTLFEAGRYPRHRVCGEFLSGAGQDSLRRMGLLEELPPSSFRTAHTAAFFAARASSPIKQLPHPAICLPRFILDEALARAFVRQGGRLRVGERWMKDHDDVGVVRATGRRIQSQEAGSRWVGLKAHARGVQLKADLEMHFTPQGYVGLCQLPGDVVNVCGLFRIDSKLPQSPHLLPKFLGGLPGSVLSQRLAKAEFDPDAFCSIAGLSVQPVRRDVLSEFCIGDAITMIAPLTGNGMSMALESAELAQGPLMDYSRGVLSWEVAKHRLSQLCQSRFERRLRWGAHLHRALGRSWSTSALTCIVPRWDFLWRRVFGLTR